jgi:hypothetical protein
MVDAFDRLDRLGRQEPKQIPLSEVALAQFEKLRKLGTLFTCGSRKQMQKIADDLARRHVGRWTVVPLPSSTMV